MKKIVSVVLVAIMIVSFIPAAAMTTYALDNRVEKAIEWAIAIANDDSHGYSQSSRNGPDYDCSSFVSTAFKQGGFSVSGSLNTNTMADAFKKVGFTQYKKSEVSLQRGDILLKPGSHVELYLGDNKCVAAHDNYDGKTGDGNGKEIQVRTKNYCTFCKQANYTYILRYNGSTTTSYTYSFNFNANGGSLGSTCAFTISYGREFQILNTTCARSGYTWAGWNVKRNNDNKWYVEGRGWCTESQISSNGYTKKVYSNYQTCKLDDSWINGISGNGSYTFYAVWIQNRNTQLLIYTSAYGEGSDHLTALNNASNSGCTQERMYVWYILYDANTGTLMNTYTNRDYTVCVSIYDPDGNLVYDTTYEDSDANWISIVPQMSGEYVARAKYVCGSAEASVATGYNVSYDADLVSSNSSLSLDLNKTNSRTATITVSGNYPGKYGTRYSIGDTSIVSASWGDWNGNSIPITVTGKKYGTTNLVISLYENYTGDKNVVATVTVPITVTCSHSYGSWTTTKAATCATTGTKEQKCTVCGEKNAATIAATGNHTAGSWKTTKEATCTTTGTKVQQCTSCGKTVNTATIAATGHSYSYKVTKAPTISATGTLTGTCPKCSGTTTVTLPKLNATDYTYKVTKAATCTATGTGRYTWKTTIYGTFIFDVTISETEHSYTKKVTDPTCIAQGYTTYTCSGCGNSYKDNYTIALRGHAYVNGFCTRCGDEDPDYAVDDNVPKIVVNSTNATAGDTVIVDVKFENNPGLINMNLSLNYDTSALKLVSVENGTIFDNLMSGQNYLFYSNQDELASDVLCTITFEVLSTAAVGDYAIEVVCHEATNEAEMDVSVASVNGKIAVNDILYGDANGDGTVNAKDLTRLSLYLANYDYSTGLSSVEISVGGDATGDGEINAKDLSRLCRYLAYYDYSTGTSSIVLGPNE